MSPGVGRPIKIDADNAETRDVPGGLDNTFERALSLAVDGSSPGYQWLWNRFSRQVAAFVRARNVDDPDDLTNEVFEAAFRGLRNFSGDEDQFVAWIFTIARNKIVDAQRKRSRSLPTDPLSARPDVLDTVSGGDVERDAWGSGLSPGTRALLARLTDDQQEVLFLRLVADLSLEQTASVMGRSSNSVKALQHRAVNAMRRLSAPQENSPEAVTK